MLESTADLCFEASFEDTPPAYWYEGQCPATGEILRLPRTSQAEAIARQLMAQLVQDEPFSQEGKMYGILLAETASGELQVLKAFSGLLGGKNQVEGWVPPILGRDHITLEENLTLSILSSIKDEILTLQQLPERKEYEGRSQEFNNQIQQLIQKHHQAKQERKLQREQALSNLLGEQLEERLEQLDDQSRREGIERRNLKRQRDAMLNPLKNAIAQADQQILELKRHRKELSRQLQTHMHTVYFLTNFAGTTLPLQQVIPTGTMPTGTGDCCAPKLLHYAATHQLKPIAMAEFWWGAPSLNGTRTPGEFYGACEERCQPLMGFLLSGLSDASTYFPSGSTQSLRCSVSELPALDLPVLYEDAFLIAVNKPAGLLSVAGRSSDRQDSVLSRLRLTHETLIPVHRLDQDTSGILLLAKDWDTYRHLSRQFQQRQVIKIYQAVLAGLLLSEAGIIDLPLWSDPGDRPYQKVDWQRGKPSQTNFRVLQRTNDSTRIELQPLTGRTHQLRVHAAHPEGLGIPISGDRLYAPHPVVSRLHLHARALEFAHPNSREWIVLQTDMPF